MGWPPRVQSDQGQDHCSCILAQWMAMFPNFPFNLLLCVKAKCLVEVSTLTVVFFIVTHTSPSCCYIETLCPLVEMTESWRSITWHQCAIRGVGQWTSFHYITSCLIISPPLPWRPVENTLSAWANIQKCDGHFVITIDLISKQNKHNKQTKTDEMERNSILVIIL